MRPGRLTTLSTGVRRLACKVGRHRRVRAWERRGALTIALQLCTACGKRLA